MMRISRSLCETALRIIWDTWYFETGGVLSFKKTRGLERELIEEVERRGFIYSGRQARIFLFTKKEDSGNN